MQKIYKPIVFLACLVPAIILSYKIILNQLGPEPIKYITHHTGEWTMRFIILTLLMSPLRKLTNSIIWIKYRRMFGLFVFFYATLHLLTYIGLDYRFDWEPLLNDVVKKKFIFIGFAAWVLLIPLVITSTTKMKIILKKNWKILHRLIYIIAIFGVLHFIWLSKTIYFEPLIYLIIVGFLLILRINFKSLFSKIR